MFGLCGAEVAGAGIPNSGVGQGLVARDAGSALPTRAASLPILAAVDSVAGAADSLDVASVDRASKADSLAEYENADSVAASMLAAERGRSARDSSRTGKPPRFSAPRWVMLRSALVPGWGQAYNGAWLKAGLIAASEVALALKLRSDHNALSSLTRRVSQAQARGDTVLANALIDDYNARLDPYTTKQWLTAGVVFYALLDAYIDAHFRNFKVEFEEDPALPGGAPPSRSVRVSLRVRY